MWSGTTARLRTVSGPFAPRKTSPRWSAPTVLRPPGTAASLRSSGEPYMLHPLAVTGMLAEMNMDMVSLRDRLAARRGGRHRDQPRGDRQAVRPGCRPLRGRRDETRQVGVLLGGGAAGGKLPQDVPGDDRRHPGDHRQAHRPVAQHAHPPEPSPGETRANRAGDPGDLRTHQPPPGYGQDPG